MADHNPIQVFHTLFCKAQENSNGQEINAMLLTTIGFYGCPSSRMVLLKKYDWNGFIFFSNYNSKKGQEIAENSNVHLLFRWNAINTEIHIQGKAEKVPQHISENYFEVRPRASKLGAHVSQQSAIIASRDYLEDAFTKVETTFKNKNIPKPLSWGGYLVKPSKITFINSSSDAVKQQTYTINKNYDWSLRTYNYLKEI